jgi:DUF4097 and DUF4098 domain-containing protein YvlB
MQKSFEVTGPAELEIRLASGDITVDAATEGRVEVELTAHDEESQRLIDDATVELREQGGRPQVIVEVPNKRGFSLGQMFSSQGITCRVRCPEGSGLSTKTKSADVVARGVLGGLHVQTASGDVEADRVTGGINVKSASGDLTVREAGDGVSVQTASGDVDIDIVRGPVSVNSASGDVTIGEAYDNVNVSTVSGDQDHGAVMRGTVSAHSVSGDVSVGVRRGSKVFLDCNTVSGDTRSDLELTGDVPAGDGPLVEIRAKTVSGDISITRAPAPSDSTQGVHA